MQQKKMNKQLKNRSSKNKNTLNEVVKTFQEQKEMERDWQIYAPKGVSKSGLNGLQLVCWKLRRKLMNPEKTIMSSESEFTIFFTSHWNMNFHIERHFILLWYFRPFNLWMTLEDKILKKTISYYITGTCIWVWPDVYHKCSINCILYYKVEVTLYLWLY